MRNAWGVGRILQAEWLAYVKTMRRAKSMAFSEKKRKKEKKKHSSEVQVYLVRERVVQEKSGEAGRSLIM